MASELDRLRGELEKLIDELYEGEHRILVHGEGKPGARVLLVAAAGLEPEAAKEALSSLRF